MNSTLLTPPVTDDATRRQFLTALGAAGLLTACASPNTDTAAPTGGGYPRTVDHGLGSTVIPTAPQRIVCTQNTFDTDAVIALGRTPLAVGDVEGEEIAPWVTSPVEFVAMEPEPNLEAIAALRPDLILGQNGRVEPAYSQLSAIAPVVSIDIDTTDWRAAFRTVAVALGEEQRAEQEIRDVETALAATAERVRACTGDRTLAVVASFGDGLYYAFGPGIVPGGYVTPYGFTFAPQFTAEPSLELSGEQLGMLDADVIAYYGTAGAALTAEPLFVALPAAAAGRVVELSLIEQNALSPGPLRTAWAIDNVVPRLLAAFDC